MNYLHLFNPATSTHYKDGGCFPSDSPVPFEGGQWIEGLPPSDADFYRPLDPITAINKIISDGQAEMAATPLPADIRLQIYQLTAALPICAQHNDWDAVRAAINSVVVAGHEDVSSEQQGQVEALKAQMLAVLNGL